MSPAMLNPASGCGEIRHTRRLQVSVGATPWRFESSQPHRQAEERASRVARREYGRRLPPTVLGTLNLAVHAAIV